jgi:hypothetical protein
MNTMSKHADKSESDGHKDTYDHTRTKDVNESGQGKHGDDDKGDE